MGTKINKFRSVFFFLSNFYMAPVTYNGQQFTNSEAAFQAQKCKYEKDKEQFLQLDPSAAKKLGYKVVIRDDWEEVKVSIMKDIVTAKFTQNPVLKDKLLATEDAYLEEGNDWGDKTWGTVNGVGKNYLGKILMEVREILRSPKELVVLERENGFYGGYEKRDGRYEQVFNTAKNMLSFSTNYYIENGYVVTYLDKSHEKEFMEGRVTLEQAIKAVGEL